jgi:O-antigen/teichoic acid export membrane protein
VDHRRLETHVESAWISDSALTDRQDSHSQEEPPRPPPQGSLPLLPERLASVRSLLRGNQDLLRNASSLAATTGLTSLFGFAFWIYAARVFSSNAVGYGSAAVSTMMLLGTIGLFGLDTMLIGELPRGKNRGGLTMAACIAAGIGSFALGLGWALISLAFGARFAELNGTVGRMLIFSLGVAITGATIVFDQATIGLMRGGLQLSRNTAMSIAKMAVLPAAALVLHDAFGVGIMLAWVIGTVASLVPVAIMIKRSGSGVLHRPDWVTLWRLRKVALAHNWLNLAITVPTKLIPVLVAVVVSPSSNGAYYIATMISSFLFMVPQSLSTVLFAVASAAPEKVAEKLRFVLRTSVVIGVLGGLVMALCAHLLLSAFKPAYATLATGPLLIMIVGYLPGLPSNLYIAVSRVKGRFNQAAIFLVVFAALRMAALVVGGKIDGLYGLSYAMLAVAIVQAFITTPYVLRAAYGSVTVRPEAAGELPQPVELVDDPRLQQEAGLDALIALATRVTTSLPDVDTSAVPTRSRVRFPLTRPQPMVSIHRWLRGPSAGSVASANPAIRETTWWPDTDEETFRSRQEAGMAALIAIATHAAKF